MKYLLTILTVLALGGIARAESYTVTATVPKQKLENVSVGQVCSSGGVVWLSADPCLNVDVDNGKGLQLDTYNPQGTPQ